MNKVILIGRITRDLELRYTPNTQMAVLTFNIAVDRITRQGEEKKTDFPRITVFGKQAESLQRYKGKGDLIAVSGRLQTGNYTDKNGNTVYTTDVIAESIDFLSSSSQGNTQRQDPFGQQLQPQPKQQYDPIEPTEMPDSFQAIEEDIPF